MAWRWQKINWSIKSQMYFGSIILMVIVALLAIAGIQGVLKFRSLTKNIRHRATELPLSADLSQSVSDLRVSFAQIQSYEEKPHDFAQAFRKDRLWLLMKFKSDLEMVGDSLHKYEDQLSSSSTLNSGIGDISNELATVKQIRQNLDEIMSITKECDLVFDDNGHSEEVAARLEELQTDVQQLPTFMKQRMDTFAENARANYHAWTAFSVALTICAFLLILSLAFLFHKWIFKPLQALINGSRQVAAGNYDYRIKLETQDEVAELADALNDMTSNFQQIKNDLNDQVRQRTKEVVRSEQMASVGFLAAGVAHEINNPLAAIAWSAESLEMRLYDILDSQPHDASAELTTISDDIEEMKTYLRRIQDEAFRCKGITSSLLDFSRLGDASKQPTNLTELVQGVIDMVRPLSKYRRRNLNFEGPPSLMAQINAQEMKQVVLNLLTNALDSVDEDGHVYVSLESLDNVAYLSVEDDGCGMTDEVMEHLFEPFFTRRNDGKGTGLGLSITYRIIDEHGGTIEPHSEGPQRGSKFVVTLPMMEYEAKQKAAA